MVLVDQDRIDQLVHIDGAVGSTVATHWADRRGGCDRKVVNLRPRALEGTTIDAVLLRLFLRTATADRLNPNRDESTGGGGFQQRRL